ncbi:hypothetical protein BH23ACT5_BH23ACT5_01870 [soil metagenome]
MRERVSVAARRHVLTQHTRRRRFEEVLGRLGIQVPPSQPRISILLATNRPERLTAGLSGVDAQAWGNKDLVLILHGAGSFDMAAIAPTLARLTYPTSVVALPAELTLGQCLNEGLDHATGELVTKMDNDDHYRPNHLLDLYAAHSYGGAQVVGKASNIVYPEDHDMTIDWRTDREERFGPHVPGATMLLARDLLDGSASTASATMSMAPCGSE